MTTALHFVGYLFLLGLLISLAGDSLGIRPKSADDFEAFIRPILLVVGLSLLGVPK